MNPSEGTAERTDAIPIPVGGGGIQSVQPDATTVATAVPEPVVAESPIMSSAAVPLPVMTMPVAEAATLAAEPLLSSSVQAPPTAAPATLDATEVASPSLESPASSPSSTTSSPVPPSEPLTTVSPTEPALPAADSAPATLPPQAADTAPATAAIPDPSSIPNPSSTTPPPSEPAAPTPTSPVQPSPQKSKFKKLLPKLVLVGVFLLMGTMVAAAVFKGDEPTDAPEVLSSVNIDLANLGDTQGIEIDSANQLRVNGQLVVNGSLVIPTANQPTDPKTGQLYLNAAEGTLQYYNGNQFVVVADRSQVISSLNGTTGAISLGGGLTLNGNVLSADLTSVQDQLNDVSFVAGNGISISGTTISNAGVVSLEGAGDVSITNLGNGRFQLFSTVGVALAPQVAQLDSTNNSTIHINKTGTGNLIQLANAGSDVFSVTNTGATTIADTLSVTGATTLTDTLQVTGPTTLASTLQVSGNLSVDPGSGVVTNQVAAHSGANLLLTAGNDSLAFQAYGRTFTFEDTGPANQTICTAGINCARGAGTAVLLAPSSIQVDDSGNASIFINDIGGGLLAQLQADGVDQFTLDRDGNVATGGDLTLGGNTISSAGPLTIGTTTNNLTIQGSGTSLRNHANGFSQVLNFETPSANVTYQIEDAPAGVYGICTTTGNCAGVGGGVTTPGGTLGQLARFSGTQTIVDSIIADNGAIVTIAGGLTTTGNTDLQGDAQVGGNVQVTGDTTTGNLSVGGNAQVGGDISGTNATLTGNVSVQNTLAVDTITRASVSLTIGETSYPLLLQGSNTQLRAQDNGFSSTLVFDTPSGSDKTITVPNASGTVAVTASGPIQLDALGDISCATCVVSGGGANGAVDTLNLLNGALTLQGTTNQITVSDNGTDTITLSLPQDINTNSNVAFNNQSLSGTLTVTGNTSLSTLTTSGLASLNGLDVTTNASIGGNLTIAGSTQANAVTATSVDVSGNTSVGGDFTVTGNTTVTIVDASGLVSANALQVTNNADIDGGLSVQAAITGGSTLQVDGALISGNPTLAGLLTLHDGNSNTGMIQLESLSQNTLYTLPDAGQAAVDICLSTGNCAGAGNSVTTAGGTTNTLALFTGSQAIGDSIISQSGTTISIAGNLNLNTALEVSQGGTGTTSFTSNGVLYGNGSGSIQTTAAPTAGQVLLGSAGGAPVFTTLSGDVTVSASGIVAIQPDSVVLAVDTVGDFVQALGSLTGLSTTGNSGEGSTPSLSVLYGSTVNTAVQGNTEIEVAAGVGLSGGGTIVLGSGGTVTLDSTLGISIEGSEITDGTITNVDLADDTLLENKLSTTNSATNGYILTYDQTSGGFTWVDSTAVGADDVDSFNSLIGPLTLAGTTGQLIVTDNGSDTITLALDANVSLLGQTIEGSEITDLTITGADIANDTIALGTKTTGNYVQNLGTLTGLSTTGNTGEGSTPTLSILYGSTVNTAVQGNTEVTVTAGTGLTGGGTLTLGAGGTLTLDSTLGTSIDTSEITDSTILEVDLSTTNSAASGQILTYDQTSGGFTWIDSDVVGGDDVDSLNSLIGPLTLAGTTGQLEVTDNGTDTITLALHADVSLLGQTIEGSEITNLTITGADIANDTIALGTKTTGNYVATFGSLTGLSTTGNTGEGSMPTLSVLYGSTANRAVQGNTSITVTAGTNLSGGGSITLGAGGTVTVNTVANPTFGTSVTAPLINLGASATTTGQLRLFNAGSTFAATLSSANLGQTTTYTLPDPGGASATICLSTGNCAGAGSGLTGSGTSGYLARFTGSQNVGDSVIFQNGTDIGIGTTTPAPYRLNIAGAANATNLYQNGYQVCDTSGNCVGTGGSGDVLHTGNSYGVPMIIGTNDNYSLNLETNNTIRMTILNNGNVGIGTMTPSSLLHVSGGDVIIDRKATTSGLTRTLTVGGARNGSNNSFAQLDLQNYDTTGTSSDFVGASIQGQEDGPDSARLAFYTASSGVMGDPKVVVTSGGDIGVGLTAPSYKLDVSGGSGIVGRFSGRVIGADAVNADEFTTKSQLDTATAGGTKVSSLNGLTGALNIVGNTQIAVSPSGSSIDLSIQGDSVGDAQLQYNTGQHLTTTSSPSFTGLSLTSSLSVNGGSGFSTSLNANILSFNRVGASYIDQQGVGGSINIRTSNASSVDTMALTVLASGNVGIGTTTPSTKLDVRGTVSGLDELVLSDATDQINYITGPLNRSIVLRSGNVNGLDDDVGIDVDTDTSSGVSYTRVLTIDSSSNLGIGTNTPVYKLDVSAGTGIVGRFSGRVIGGDAVNTNEFTTKSQLDAATASGTKVSSLNSLTGDLSIVGNTQVAVSPSGSNINLSIQGDSIGDSQLAFNTGQHLTTTSSPTFASPTVTNLNISAGNNNGIQFWNGNSAYAITMGNDQDDHGTVTDYSIHSQIGSTAGRGFTWGSSNTAVSASLNALTGDFTSSGTITAALFSGSGANLTNLNASQLTSGTVPDARITGAYTGLTNLTGSGNVDFARFLGNAADTAAAPSFSWTGDTDTGMFRAGTNILAFSTGGVEEVRILANGRVGIGTTAPGALLHVNGGTGIVGQFSGRVIGGDAVNANEFTTKGQLDAATADGTKVSSLNSLTGALNIVGNSQISVTPSGSNINLAIQGDSIGDAELQFNTGQHLTTSSTPTFNGLVADGGNVELNRPNTTGGWARGLFMRTTDGLTRYGGVGVYGSSTTINSIFLAHGDSPWTSGTGLYILPNGNVGIGTTNPGYRLDVQGPAQVTGALTLGTQATAGTHAVRADRTISAGTGLNGGGDLTANRTLNIANTTVTANSYGSASSVATFTVNAQGQLTAASTTAIAINANQITAGTLTVARGGTGAATHTAGGILYGNGTSAITNSGVLTNGQLLIGDGSGAPTVATLTGGDGLTVSNGAGSITLAVDNTVCRTSNNCTAVGAAAGDLSGTFPAPTVVGIRGTPVSINTLTTGQFLQYNGTDWINQSLSGDILINASGVATIQPNSVALGTDTVGNYVGTLAAGAGVTISGSDGEGTARTVSLNTTYLNSNYFLQGGNSFSTTAVLGTNDGQALALETNGTTRMTILANGNVGVGTGSPSEKLEVQGGVKLNGSSQMMQLGTIPAASGNGFVRGSMIFSRDGDLTYNEGTGLWEKSGGQINVGGLFHSHNDGINLFTIPVASVSMNHTNFKNNYVRLTIDNSGNIGVGTSSPSYKFDVSGGTGIVGRFSGRVIGGNAINTDEFVTLSQLNAYTGSGTAFVQGGNSYGTMATLGTNDNQHLALETNGSERLRITNAGNIGIGLTNPSVRLHVSGDSIISGNLSIGTALSYGQLTLGNDQWITGVNAAGTGGINLLKVNAQNQIQLGTSLSIDGGFLFPTDAGLVTFTDMQITNATPAGTPHGYSLKLDSENAITVYGESNGAGNVQNLRVGIGTASPTSTLDVQGGNINTSGNLMTAGTTRLTSAGLLQNITGITSSGTITFSGLTANRLVTTTTGGQLSNTITAANLLSSVTGTTGTGNLVFSASPTFTGTVTAPIYNATTRFEGVAADTVTAPSFTWTGDTNTGLFQPAADVVAITTGGTEALRVLANGNVGIGTTSPTSKLHISGAADATNAPLRVQATTGAANLKLFSVDASEGGGFAVEDQASSGFLPSFTFTSSGVNGYGGSLVGQVPVAQDIVAAAGGAVVINGRRSDGTNLTAAHVLNVRNNATSLMVVTATGDVGIGTSSPSSKLDVQGSGLFSGSVTAAGINLGANDIVRFGGTGGYAYTSNPRYTVDQTTLPSSFNNFSTNLAFVENTGSGFGAYGTYQTTKLYSNNAGIQYFYQYNDLDADTPIRYRNALHSGSGWNAWRSIASQEWVGANYSPITGSGNYIQNSTTLQSSANFNISGTGTAAILNATNRVEGRAADTAAAPSFTWSGDTNTGMWRPGADILSLTTGGTEAMRILANGHIGIGTTAPQGYLHIKTDTSGNLDGIILENDVSPNPNSDGPYVTFQYNEEVSSPVENTDTLGGLRFRGSYASGAYSGYAASIKAIQDGTASLSSSPGALLFSTTADGSTALAERMRITGSGNIGIGTNNPGKKLEVSVTGSTDGIKIDGTTNPALSLFTGGNLRAYLAVSTSSGGFFNGSVANDVVLRAESGANIAVTTGSTARLYVASGGNVGIGTTAPANNLQVANILRVGPHTGNSFYPGNIPGDTGAIVLTSSASQTRQSHIWQSTGTTGEGGLHIESTHFPIVLNAGTQGASSVLLNPTAGNVGIGITIPTEKLHVAGNGLFTGTLTANSDISTGNVYKFNSNTTGDKILLYGTSYGIGIESSTLTNWSNSQFRWRTGGTSAATGTERMLLSSTALDIGVATNISGTTTAPIFNGTTRFEGNATDSATAPSFTWTGDVNTGIWRPGTDMVSITTAGSEALRVLANGNVGIGATGPTAKLEVNGDVNLNVMADYQTEGRLRLGRANLATRYHDIKVTNDATPATNYMTFAVHNGTVSSTTDVLTLRGDGNVGIGTTSPSYPLDVVGHGRVRSNLYIGTDGNYLTSQTSGTYGSIQINGGGAGAYEGYSIDGRTVFMHNGTTTTGLYNDVDNEWLFRSVHNAASYLYHDGSIKLETTATGASVTGGIDFTTQALGNATDSVTAPSYSWTGDTNTGIWRPAADVLSVTTGGSEALRVLANGNIGIGTTSPSAKLHVSGNSIISGALSVGTTSSYGQLTFGNNQWTSAVDAAGTGYVNLFKLNAQNQIQLGAALSIDGGFNFPSDAGLVTFADMPITGTQAAGTPNGYTLGIGYQNALSIYGESNGTNGVQNVRVGVGTASPANTFEIQGTDAQNRLFYNGTKSALRTGYILDSASVGDYSLAFGYQTTGSGPASLAFGDSTIASSANALAGGNSTTASGQNSVALGASTTASNSQSFAMGQYATASGYNSSAFGDSTTAQAYGSTVVGRYNVVQGTTNSWVATDQLFVVGNGSSSGARSNALTVLKNGNTTIGASGSSGKLVVGNSSTENQYALEINQSHATAGAAIFRQGSYGMDRGLRIYDNAGSDYIAMSVQQDNMGIIQAGDGAAWRSLGLNPFGGWVGVGTGTSGPSAALHVKDNIAVIKLADADHPSSNIGFASYLSFRDNSDVEAGYMGFGSTGNNHLYMSNSLAGGNILLRAGNTDIVTLSSSGGVFANTFANASTGSLVYFNTTTGQLSYSSSSARYKTDIVTLEDDWMKILNARQVKYTDKANGLRLTGFIAEELHQLGLNELVTYDATGRPDGVTYEKVPLYNLGVLKNHEARIKTLEANLGIASTGGYLKNGDAASFASLNVSGNTVLTGSLRVKGSVTFDKNLLVGGTLTVNNDLIAKADLYIEGVLVSRGKKIDVAPLESLGLTEQPATETTPMKLALAEVEGTQVAGSITLTAGDLSEAGDIAEVIFNTPYTEGVAPRIVITPVGGESAQLNAYITKTANGFKVGVVNAPEAGTTYSFEYIIIGSHGVTAE